MRDFFRIKRRMKVLAELIRRGEQTTAELVINTGSSWYGVTEALAWLISEELVENERLVNGSIVYFVHAR